DLVVIDRVVERLDLLTVDAVPEGGVDHHRDQVLRVLGPPRGDDLVELLETRVLPAFGGDVGSVDDDVSWHTGQSQALGTSATYHLAPCARRSSGTSV